MSDIFSNVEIAEGIFEDPPDEVELQPPPSEEATEEVIVEDTETTSSPVEIVAEEFDWGVDDVRPKEITDLPPPEKKTAVEQVLEGMTGKYLGDLLTEVVKLEDLKYDAFTAQVNEITETANRYYNGGFDANIGRVEEDIVRLSSLLVIIANPLGYYQGLVEEYEDRRKTIKASLYAEAKEIREREECALNNQDAEAISRMLTRKYIPDKPKVGMLSRILTNVWFGTKSFIAMLEDQLIKRKSEQKLGIVAEGEAFASPGIQVSVVAEPDRSPPSQPPSATGGDPF